MPGSEGRDREGRAGSVRGRSQAQLDGLGDHLAQTPRQQERSKVGAGAGEVLPRPHVVAVLGAVPSVQKRQVTTREPADRSPSAPRLCMCLFAPRPQWAGCGAPLGPPCP
ncbi:hypothetical protein NN561_019686 [Cricetulus griseus]